MTKKQKESISGLEGLDLESLRLDSDFENITLKRVLNVVQVRKPSKQEFFRVKPDDGWTFRAWILDYKEDREIYLVSPEIAPNIEQELKPVTLFSAYNRRGDYFLIYVPLPRDGKWNRWHESLHQIVVKAKENWVRADPDINAGHYKLVIATGDIKEPVLPEVRDFKQLLDIAFRDRFISDLGHPVIKKLEGRI